MSPSSAVRPLEVASAVGGGGFEGGRLPHLPGEAGGLGLRRQLGFELLPQRLFHALSKGFQSGDAAGGLVPGGGIGVDVAGEFAADPVF